uniref:Uncharacterized protein n=1 Tax=Anguilla anguilla TaxID=7936 RepID=A0A0E9WGN4_ANGAN
MPNVIFPWWVTGVKYLAVARWLLKMRSVNFQGQHVYEVQCKLVLRSHQVQV